MPTQKKTFAFHFDSEHTRKKTKKCDPPSLNSALRWYWKRNTTQNDKELISYERVWRHHLTSHLFSWDEPLLSLDKRLFLCRKENYCTRRTLDCLLARNSTRIVIIRAVESVTQTYSLDTFFKKNKVLLIQARLKKTTFRLLNDTIIGRLFLAIYIWCGVMKKPKRGFFVQKNPPVADKKVRLLLKLSHIHLDHGGAGKLNVGYQLTKCELTLSSYVLHCFMFLNFCTDTSFETLKVAISFCGWLLSRCVYLAARQSPT